MATYESIRYGAIPINATQIADGSVSDSEYQFINTLGSNAQTQLNARLPLAGGTMTGDLNLGDNIDINVSISNGSKKFTAYTMDLTKKYLEINSDYRS